MTNSYPTDTDHSVYLKTIVDDEIVKAHFRFPNYRAAANFGMAAREAAETVTAVVSYIAIRDDYETTIGVATFYGPKHATKS